MKNSRFLLLFPLSTFLLIVGACILHFTNLSSVGAEYDELLTANTSLGCPHPTLFLEYVKWFRGHCAPIMLMPYIGSLMALPTILARFLTPFEIQDVRLLNQIMILLSSLGFSYLVGKWIGKGVGFLTLLFLVIDPPLIFAGSLQSIVVVPFILRLSLLTIILHSLKVKRLTQVSGAFLGLIAGLMVWTKVDGFFFLASIMGGFVISELSIIKQHVRSHWRLLVVTLISFCVGVSPFLLYLRLYLKKFLLVNSHYSSFKIELLVEKTKSLLLHWAAPDFYHYVTFEQLSLPRILWLLAISIPIIWLLSALIVMYRHQRYRFISYAFFIFIGLYLLYGGLNLIHHRLLLYPLPQLLLALAVYELKRLVGLVLVTLSLVASIGIWITYQQGFIRTCGGGSYTCAIDNLYRTVSGTRPIITGDWGIANQLIFFSNGSLPVSELSFDAQAGNTSGIEFKHEDCSLLILRPEAQTQLPKARSFFLSKIEKDTPPTLIIDRFGKTKFEVYDLCSSPSSEI